MYAITLFAGALKGKKREREEGGGEKENKSVSAALPGRRGEGGEGPSSHRAPAAVSWLSVCFRKQTRLNVVEALRHTFSTYTSKETKSVSDSASKNIRLIVTNILIPKPKFVNDKTFVLVARVTRSYLNLERVVLLCRISTNLAEFYRLCLFTGF